MTSEIINTPDQFLAVKAEAIRTAARNAVFEIGKHLTEAREKCPHGKWLSWLESEFGWSHTTSDKYLSIHAAIVAGKLHPKLQFGLSISSLALLSAPLTPEAAVNEVAEQVKAGRKVVLSRVKATVAKHRGIKPPLRETQPTGDQLEGRGVILHFETRADSKGRQQPAHKSNPIEPPSDAEQSTVERKQRYAADNLISVISAKEAIKALGDAIAHATPEEVVAESDSAALIRLVRDAELGSAWLGALHALAKSAAKRTGDCQDGEVS